MLRGGKTVWRLSGITKQDSPSISMIPVLFCNKKKKNNKNKIIKID